ncbi:MAG: response regulator [Desulfuromonadaceae bacterium]|nr:response regulator [Desulfuromonadaceae bacterium]
MDALITKQKIIIIDDEPVILELLSNIFNARNWETKTFQDGTQALNFMEENPPDLILLDISMPKMNGYELCREVKRRGLKAPVVFLSGMAQKEDIIRGFQAGGVDYITKPFHYQEVLARIDVHLNLRSMAETIELQKVVEKKILEISKAQHATIFAMAKLAENRDEDTGSHLERVQEYCRQLAEYLNSNSSYSGQLTPDYIDCLYHASTLHDIGKVAIPDSVLLKPGKLTEAEFEIMKTHTVIGGSNMQTVYNRYPDNSFIGMGIEIALYHHERWDGKGYPDGLSGTNIPLSARIMALADVYDALCSDRCYRKALDHEHVKEMIAQESGKQFDTEIVAAFLELESNFKQIRTTSAYNYT